MKQFTEEIKSGRGNTVIMRVNGIIQSGPRVP